MVYRNKMFVLGGGPREGDPSGLAMWNDHWTLTVSREDRGAAWEWEELGNNGLRGVLDPEEDGRIHWEAMGHSAVLLSYAPWASERGTQSQDPNAIFVFGGNYGEGDASFGALLVFFPGETRAGGDPVQTGASQRAPIALIFAAIFPPSLIDSMTCLLSLHHSPVCPVCWVPCSLSCDAGRRALRLTASFKKGVFGVAKLPFSFFNSAKK